MQADKTTINDLSIFHPEEELSLFHHLNFTRTIGGKDWLRDLLNHPLTELKEVQETQLLLQKIISVQAKWPEKILNGTIMVIERFYETAVNEIPPNPNPVNSISYKLFNGPDYSIIRYSVGHFFDFIQGMHELADLLSGEHTPPLLQKMIDRIRHLLSHVIAQFIIGTEKGKVATPQRILHISRFIRYHFKQQARELIDIYSKLDAYYSLAIACSTYRYQFPAFIESEVPSLEATQLYHPLLETPVSYDIALAPNQNFLFLTGANMAGKSTFIKSVGVATYLAHIGMGVPAASMQLTLFDGLLSNIQVTDNILKGESYFFNEVQRIRKTIEKINDGRKWLILIDELFKGTNVQDAMKCSTAVIEGLRKMKNALFILSTHLYEIGEDLQQYNNIQFRYFETQVQDDQLVFNYQLKEGISNDRLGYLILKKEGVVDMLEKL
jgi:DNA mismatch repair ATPase MutS